MKIDIYNTRNKFIAVRQGDALPDGMSSYRYFKTIELNKTDVRIGLSNPVAVMNAIEEVGWSAM